jgi:cytoplasmic FMR1 interacting protein
MSAISDLETIWVTEARVLSMYSMVENGPKVQSHATGLELAILSRTNTIQFQDHIGLQTEVAQEIITTAGMEALVVEGLEHIKMLYTFRSIGCAVPVVNNLSIENKYKIDLETFQVLAPQIEKIKHFMEFQERCIVMLLQCVQDLVINQVRGNNTDRDYNAITKVMDLLQKLDDLKDIKASLTTDFSRYNRVLQVLRIDLPNGDSLAQEKHRLQLFLSNFKYSKSLILNNLRDALKRIPNHELVLIEILQQNVDFIENERYVLIDEKYRLVRSLPQLMLLIDGDLGDSVKSVNVFKDKRISLTPLQSIFRTYPVVPECGDMSMTMLIILQRSPHWDDNMDISWGGNTDRRIVSHYSLPSQWSNIKLQHQEYMPYLAQTLTEVTTYLLKKDTATAKYAAFVSKIVLDGFKLLQSWTCAVLESYHWKLTHPCPAEIITKLGKQSDHPYELAIRYNYSPRELGVLVDIISMIKSLSSMLSHAEARVAPYIRLHIHHKIQQFSAGGLVPPLHRAHKRKRTIINPLLKLRRLVSDWPKNIEPITDYICYSRQHGRVEATYKARVVGPTSTQLGLLRTMVRAMYDQRNQLRVQFFSKKDLEKEDLQLMDHFYCESLCFQYLLNYTGTLTSNSDLGDLWYREFYLELSGEVQFAIELSLAWILAEHVITVQHKSIPLVENILYTLDTYNDAAHRSISVLSQRFLYDEIEAEVNLIFDQLVFLVSDHVYSYYTNMVALRHVDAPHRERLLQTLKDADVPARRYHVPISQRSTHVLGRSIDLNSLITHHVNGKFYDDLDYCAKKLEASDLSQVMDYQKAICVVRETHELLDKHLELDPFIKILTTVDEALGPTAFAGRALMHILACLVTDVFPNYSYNGFTRRFVISPLADIDRSRHPNPSCHHSAFGARPTRVCENASKLHRSFIGMIHIEAIICTLGVAGVPLLTKKLLQFVKEQLDNTLPYLYAIIKGFPPWNYKTIYELTTCFGHIEAALQNFIRAGVDLRPEFFQAFKVVGNTISFIMGVSNMLDWLSLRGQLCALRFTNFKVHTKITGLNSPLDSTQQFCAPFGQLSCGALVHLSELTKSLQTAYILKSQISDLKATCSFYHIWSLLSLSFGLHVPGHEESHNMLVPATDLVSDDAQFGHGFLVAGAVLIHLLGQDKLFYARDFSSHLLRIEALRAFPPLQIITQGTFSRTSINRPKLHISVQFVKTKSNHAKVYNMLFALLRVHAIVITHDHDLNFVPPISHDISYGVSNVHTGPTPTT